VTQALAKGARSGGAKIYRFNRMTDLSRSKSGEWIVHTEKGDVLAHDICGEETPLQAGLDPFVKLDKGDFVGREALVVPVYDPKNDRLRS
jgi:hypothetical protein